MKRMKTKGNLLAMTMLMLASIAAYAGPAWRGAIPHVQPDGSRVQVKMHGDEYCHWLTDERGQQVELGKDGFYHAVPSWTADEIQARRSSAMRQAGAANLRKVGTPNTHMPDRGIIILVEFPTVHFTTNTDSLVLALTQEGYTNNYGAVGSAEDYFATVSNGHYTPQFDVWGPYQLSKAPGYYAGSDGMTNGSAMAQEACSLAVADGKSFAPYAQSNYEVPFVFIIWAGTDQAMTQVSGDIWAHALSVNYTFGSYKIKKYACCSEIWGNSTIGFAPNGIGTFCHEFGHILGLPDYYTTDGLSNPRADSTLGYWNIMDYGSYLNQGWNPPLYSAYDRYFLGWETPVLLKEAVNDTLPITGSQTSGTTRVISPDGKMPSYSYNGWVYYIENRQLVEWDSFLPGHGMIITKVNYNSSKWSSNKPNNTSPMLFDMIEAAGKVPYYGGSIYYGSPSDPFPGTNNVTSYAPYSQYPLSEINELEDGRVAFKFMGGKEPVTTAVEEAEQPAQQWCKRVVNGQVMIQHNNDYYTLTGEKICR